jgi:hypothetical protein
LGAEDVPVTGRFWFYFQPWAGLVAGLLAAAFSHQFGADGTFDDCQTIAPVPLLAVAAASILVCVAGGYASFLVTRRADEQTSARVASIISIGFALLAILAIALPMLGAAILPPCFQ